MSSTIFPSCCHAAAIVVTSIVTANTDVSLVLCQSVFNQLSREREKVKHVQVRRRTNEEEEEPALIYHERLIDQTKHDSSDHLQARYTAHGVVCVVRDTLI